jgi:ppGpp synthetase/RelA/SpoT-type nucleotidyltranferase
MNDFDAVTREEERAIQDASLQGQRSIVDLMGFLSRCEFFSRVYAFRSRVKPPLSILHKILRKRENDPQYDHSKVTDIVGIRFITLYREDVLKVIDEICEMIAGQHAVKPCPFVPHSIREFIVYTTTIKGDTSNISGRAKKLVERRFGTGVVVGVRERATYSSVHILAEVLDPNPTASTPPSMTIEIQIRSVFEDAWGEMDHKLRYGDKRTAQEAEEPIPSGVEAHLRHIKSLLDGVASYADTVRREAGDTREAAPTSSPTGRVKTDLDQRGYVIGRLRRQGLSSGLLDEFISVMDQKVALDERADSEASKEYDVLAEKLRSLYEQELRPGGVLTVKGTLAEEFTYYLRMEEALCLLLTGDTPEINEAINIYTEVEPLYPDVVAVQFRLGQAFSMLEKSDDAIQHYGACLTLLEKTLTRPKDEREWQLPEHQRAYIEDNVHRFLGYEYWHRARSLKLVGKLTPSQAFDEFVKAYDLTKKKIPDVGSDLRKRLHNNCLCYLNDAISATREAGRTVAPEMVKAQGEHLSVVEPQHDPRNPFVLDTLAATYLSRGDAENAKKYAWKVLDILLADNAGMGPKVKDASGSTSLFQTKRYSQATKDVMTARAYATIKGGAGGNPA